MDEQIMTSLTQPGSSLLAILTVLVASIPWVSSASEAPKPPYVVGGNQHIIIGITLDEAAVRAALPEGLEPVADLTGGLNVYTSQGGHVAEPYTRSYVWADVEGYDSVSGSKGRWILWAATNPGADKLRHIGYDTVPGDTKLDRTEKTVSGSTTVDGAEVMNVQIELTGEACSPAVGTLNYPSKLDLTGALVVTQFAWSGSMCGASPISANISVADDHPLSKYKPTALTWAVLAEDLGFSVSPQFPQVAAGE